MIYKYDARDEKCPVPLINLRLLLKKMVLGDECVVIISDAGSLNDIPKLLSKQGYCYQKYEMDNGIIKLNIQL